MLRSPAIFAAFGAVDFDDWGCYTATEVMKMYLYKPALEELHFRQSLLSDPATMDFNHAYGGTISFPEERWAAWYEKWVQDESGDRFYRYLYDPAIQQFVGEAAYHYDSEQEEYLCDVIVSAAHRNKGYGRQGLELLCEEAKARGVARLCDHIAADNPSVELFKRAGFHVQSRNGEYICVVRTL